jgi:hypothetical protein
METEDSLPYTQKPANDPYLEPKNTVHGLKLVYLRFMLITVPNVCLYLPRCVLPTGFPATILMWNNQLSHSCYMHAQPNMPLFDPLVLRSQSELFNSAWEYWGEKNINS